MIKQIQIDFLPVDSGEKSGDAIAFRYGDFSHRSLYQVVVIDGGTKESGNQLVAHLQRHYETNHVDLAICSHPDADHASGLRQVLNQCSVAELWIHKPWDHSEHIRNLFHDGRMTDNSLSQRLQDGYRYACELVQLADEKGIPVREPFAGRQSDDGFITVLGPSTEYYRELIPEFAKSPEAKTVLEKAFSGFSTAINWIQETLDIETLDETGTTRAENLSSTVLLFHFDGKKFLFTGDSGIQSLKNVISYAQEKGVDISNIELMQIPHHGSKRNISPNVLNSLHCKFACVSASKDAVKHPAKKVTNALRRRNTEVFCTDGYTLTFQQNASREGWSAAVPLPFYDQVEE